VADDGGGMYRGTAYNCLISGNTATANGGGMYQGAANNCTVVNNAAINSGGGVFEGSATNSICWYNAAGSAGGNMYGTIVSYNCSPDVPHGVAGNITNAPSFVDAASGNYHLRWISPCVNAGDNGAVFTATDLDGNTRIQYGTVDMGVYETMDSDNDQLSDAEEQGLYGSDPWDPDSDGDSFDDGEEVQLGTSPTVHFDLMQAYLSTNGASYGLYTPSAVLDLGVGDIGMMITNGNAELWVQLWQSEDLITWTNAGGAVYWSEPVDADKKFWRINVEPY